MNSAANSRLLLPVRYLDHAHASEGAPYTLVEYGDYASRLRLVFRHHPLSGIHHHAEQSAEAAEAAGVQGKFWKMPRLLYERQHGLGTKDLIGCAKELALDVDRFRHELKIQDSSDRVRADSLRARRTGYTERPDYSCIAFAATIPGCTVLAETFERLN